jgi:hypothetical protein
VGPSGLGRLTTSPALGYPSPIQLPEPTKVSITDSIPPDLSGLGVSDSCHPGGPVRGLVSVSVAPYAFSPLPQRCNGEQGTFCISRRGALQQGKVLS